MRRIFVAISLLFTAFCCSWAAAPDFAYPQTVCSNARSEMKKAAKRGDMAAVVSNALALVIASDNIDRANAPDMVNLLDSMAGASKAPYKQMLYSIEAELIGQMFEANKSEAMQRLTTDTIPANPMLWSKSQYYNRVEELVKLSVSDGVLLSKSPCQEYSSLLTSPGSVYYPSLYNVLINRGLTILYAFYSISDDVIPFAQDHAQSINSSIQTLRKGMCLDLISTIQSKPDNIAALCMAYVDYADCLLTGKEYRQYLMQKYDELKDSEYSTELLAALNNSIYDSEDYIDLCRKQIERFPDYPRIDVLRNIVASAEQPEVELKSKNLYTTSSPLTFTAEMKGVWNSLDVKALLYRLPDNYDALKYSYVKKDMIARSKLVSSIPLRGNNSCFIESVDTLSFGQQPVGRYFIVSSEPGTNRAIESNGYVNVIEVSDVGIYSGSSAEIEGDVARVTNYLWFVNSQNGRPLQGVKISFFDNKGKNIGSATTDKSGRAQVGNLKYCSKFKATALGEVIEKNFYTNENYRIYNDTTAHVNLYTDLALYHPGDTLQFAAIAYRNDSEMKHISAGVPLTVNLIDASYQTVGSQELITDEYGRANGRFVLPKDGLAGRYSLDVKVKRAIVGSASVWVENYAMPSFFVDVDSMVHTYVLGDTINICGRVSTYSGMPVADADVEVGINYSVYRYHNYYNTDWSSESYFQTLTTDADGNFSLKLNSNNLKGTAYETGYFTVRLKATNVAGESQTAYSWFSIGSTSHIEAKMPDLIEYTGIPATVDVSVKDVSGQEVSADVEYSILNDNKEVVLSGTGASPKLSIDLSSLKSGRYSCKIYLASDTTEWVYDNFLLWRRDDKCPPIITGLWVPEKELQLKSGQKDVELIVGSSFADSNILCILSDQERMIGSSWIKREGENKLMNIKLPQTDQDIRVTFVGWHEAEMYSETVHLLAPKKNDKLNIHAISFRDKIAAGSLQHWTFTLDLDGQDQVDAAALVTLSNKALNAITPFSWHTWFNENVRYINTFSGYGLCLPYEIYCKYELSKLNYIDLPQLVSPDIEMWGMDLYPRYYHAIRYLASSPMTKSSARVMNMNSLMTDSAGSYSMDAVEAEAVEDCGGNFDEDDGDANIAEELPKLRDADCPLALFNPSLVSHGSKLEISFDAPDVNTSWQMQLFAYTPQLQYGYMLRDIEASKPLMVQGNFPRFVRVGDELQLRATVYNKTDSAQLANCRFEIFNPTTGAVLQEALRTRLEVGAMSSAVFSIDIDVPCNQQLLGVRVYASNDSFTDGEQMLIGVMPSSSEVIESQPFYLQPDVKEFTLDISDKSKYNPDVTLLYCDNPVWSCLTALPAVNRLPSNTSLTARLNNLFGVSVSRAIMERYPQTADSVRSWIDTRSPMLVSQLLKNDDLKLAISTQTPWTEDAQAQTLRMAKLYTLLDADYAQSSIYSDVKSILQLQNADGGFSWCPEMRSSMFMTSCFISTMARLNHLGAMPVASDLDKALNKAVKWYDGEVLKSYQRNPKQFNYSSLLDYLYARQQAGGKAVAGELKIIYDKAYSEIAANWRQLGIYDAATAAMLLHEVPNYSNKSQDILESLRQRAVVKPDRGMYYANLPQYNQYGQMLTTSRVLQAYQVVDPNSSNVNLLRQWLLLQRQTTEWGECANVAEVIYTLLSNGSDWISAPATGTRIYVDDKLLVANAGLEERITLNGTDCGVLRIVREGGNPAWGAVIQQYIAPSAEVQKEAIPDLSISKTMFVVEGDNVTQIPFNGTVPELKVGQTVRIQLTIRNQRDMDYLLVNDPLPSCLQPVSQLSGYKYIDGVYGYQEVGKDCVSRYIDYLGRGTHLISYDCYVTLEGVFTVPVATAQSQYAPEMTAHTEGFEIITNK